MRNCLYNSTVQKIFARKAELSLPVKRNFHIPKPELSCIVLPVNKNFSCP